MSARLSDYDYVLPRELIAQRPLEHRDDARMMVLHRAEQTIEHWQFREIKTFIQRGDLVVLNCTRGLAARRFSDDDAVEFLLLERIGSTRWKCMVTPGRKMRVGATATIDAVCLRVEKITAGDFLDPQTHSINRCRRADAHLSAGCNHTLPTCWPETLQKQKFNRVIIGESPRCQHARIV